MKLSCAHISYLIYCKYLLSSLKYYHQIAVNNKFTLVRSLRVSKVSSLIGTGSMFQIAFTVLNNRRVSKFSDKCLWRLDITTDSFVSINLHPTGSDSFPAQLAEFWWEIILEIYDWFFQLDIYRNNKDRLAHSFPPLLSPSFLFFSSASATSQEYFLTYLHCFFHFFHILLVVPRFSSLFFW